MLVLSRKLGQSVQIGHDIRVTIVRLDRNTVRIGIEAPEGVRICREEIAFQLDDKDLELLGNEAAAGRNLVPTSLN